MTGTLHLIGAFLRHPRMVSSVIPTASWNVKEICSTIPRDVQRVIVEYGAGTGVIAKYLLEERRLTPDSMLILIEKNPMLANVLKEELRHDPRVSVFAGSAENVDSLVEPGVVDHVITSIPFSMMQEDVVAHIMDVTHDILKTGGELTAFQVSRKVKDILKNHDGFDEITARRLWLNLPPLIMARTKKTAEARARA
jgi:phospholipid N-methyltransferase